MALTFPFWSFRIDSGNEGDCETRSEAGGEWDGKDGSGDRTR